MIAQAVKHMLAAGMPHEAIVAAIADMENCIVPARSKGAERQARYENRKRQKASESVSSDAKIAPPNDIYSNPPVSPSANADRPQALEIRVVEAWNELAVPAGLPQSRSLNPKRRASLRARIHEHGEPAVFEAMRNTAKSKFHCGENDRGWKADLGWLLTSPEKFQKMLEVEPAAIAIRPTSPGNDRRQLFAAAHKFGKRAA